MGIDGEVLFDLSKKKRCYVGLLGLDNESECGKENETEAPPKVLSEYLWREEGRERRFGEGENIPLQKINRIYFLINRITMGSSHGFFFLLISTLFILRILFYLYLVVQNEKVV